MSNDAVYTAEAGTAKSSSRDAGGTPNKKIIKRDKFLCVRLYD